MLYRDEQGRLVLEVIERDCQGQIPAAVQYERGSKLLVLILSGGGELGYPIHPAAVAEMERGEAVALAMVDDHHQLGQIDGFRQVGLPRLAASV